jgi:ATP-binding cassette subfamily B (MDR/TAP) protein 1
MQETECPVKPFKPKSQDDQKSTSYSVSEAAAADEPFPFFGLLCYADALDWLLMVAGTIGSLMHGMAPAMSYYILGKAVDMFGNNIGNREAIVHELSKVNVLSIFKAMI